MQIHHSGKNQFPCAVKDLQPPELFRNVVKDAPADSLLTDSEGILPDFQAFLLRCVADMSFYDKASVQTRSIPFLQIRIYCSPGFRCFPCATPGQRQGIICLSPVSLC